MCFNRKFRKNLNVTRNQKIFSLSSAWLSGFIDAKGIFNVTFVKSGSGNPKVWVRFILFQTGEQALFREIANLINGCIYVSENNNINRVSDDHNGVRLEIRNRRKISIINNYLIEFPLKTRKYIKFLYWLDIIKIVYKREHLLASGFIKVKKFSEKLKNG